MEAKKILIFIGGFITGGAAGVFGSKKYFETKYQKKYEKDHDDLEEYYHRTDEYTRNKINEVCATCDYFDKSTGVCQRSGDIISNPKTDDCMHYEAEYEDDGVNPTETDSVPGGRMSQEERKEVKEKLNRNWQETTNYAAMYKGATPKDQNDEEEPEGEEPITPEEAAFEEHQKNRNRAPKIISEDAFVGLPDSIEKDVLYFYTEDEVLTDDNEEPFEVPEAVIGDALTKFNFIESDELIIFVMNYATDTAYEIQKIDGSWTDTH